MSLSSPVPLLTSVETASANKRAWISDIWGVLHNGRSAFPAAGNACVRFRKQGGRVLLVTNAPYPEGEVAQMLRRLGVPRDAWDAIVTSGDVTRSLIARYRGRAVLHIGPDRYLGMFDGVDVHRTAEINDAAAVVVTGLIDDERETPGDYAQRLAEFRARNLPLICANPDIMVERGNRLVPCAGALAEAYLKLGGNVAYAGKPHPPIYVAALAKLHEVIGSAVSNADILAIGDGIRTDIAGAAAMGLDAVFIASALHVPEHRRLDGALLGELFAGHARPPVAAMDALVW